MLRKAGSSAITSEEKINIKEAAFPAPFKAGLEFSSPARGTWNIVHTGMLIPDSHQIFVCARGCLRGVVLTAAEMNAMDRYSSILIEEDNVLSGNMEELMIEGVTDILGKLSYTPRAILLFISCQHFFLAYDQQLVFDSLRDRFPHIRFTDCYMIPTLRKSGLTPDQKMRKQLFSLLEPIAHGQLEKDRINLLGSNLPLSQNCELRDFLKDNNKSLVQINDCKSFDDYMDLARSSVNLFYEPIVLPAMEDLKDRLGQDYYYLTFTFDFDRLDRQYAELAQYLSLPAPDFSPLRDKADKRLKELKDLLGNTPIVIDYTFTFRILSFAMLLLKYGFNVTRIYTDIFLPEDKDNFDRIREAYPDIMIYSTNRPQMRFVHGEAKEKTIAIGQKAAHFSMTPYFVNVSESGGMFGYNGILDICDLMEEAFREPKDLKTLIQQKGYGCESCIC